MVDTVEVTYARFKEILASKKIRPQHELIGTIFNLFAYDGPIKYTSIVYTQNPNITGIDWTAESANHQDFVANVLPISNRSLQTSPIAALSKFHGRIIELAAADTTGFCEWSFNAAVEIYKVRPKPIAAEWGDYAIIEIWTKPGVMGPNPVKVEDFGSGIFVHGGDGNTGCWYEGSGGGRIPAHCTVRCYYHKAAGTARRFIIDAEFLE